MQNDIYNISFKNVLLKYLKYKNKYIQLGGVNGGAGGAGGASESKGVEDTAPGYDPFASLVPIMRRQISKDRIESDEKKQVELAKKQKSDRIDEKSRKKRRLQMQKEVEDTKRRFAEHKRNKERVQRKLRERRERIERDERRKQAAIERHRQLIEKDKLEEKEDTTVYVEHTETLDEMEIINKLIRYAKLIVENGEKYRKIYIPHKNKKGYYELGDYELFVEYKYPIKSKERNPCEYCEMSRRPFCTYCALCEEHLFGAIDCECELSTKVKYYYYLKYLKYKSKYLKLKK
jgi:hypothetical protein